MSHRESVEGLKLGKWAGRQRELYKKGLLPKEKIKLLENTFSDWVWDREIELVLSHIDDWKKYENKQKARHASHAHPRKSRPVAPLKNKHWQTCRNL